MSDPDDHTSTKINSLKVVTGNSDAWYDYKGQFYAWVDYKEALGLLDGVTAPYHEAPVPVGGTSTTPAHPSTGIALEKYTRMRKLIWFKLTTSLSDHYAALTRSVAYGDTKALWQRLLQEFEPTNTASIQSDLGTYLTSKQGNISTSEHLDRLHATHVRLDTAVKERKLNLLQIISSLVLLNSLDSRYETLKQALFVRSEEMSYEELTDTIRVQTNRIDLAGGSASTSTVYAIQQARNGGKPVCSYCLTQGFTRNHEVSQCWTKHPELRPAVKSLKPAPAAASSRTRDPSSKRSVKALKKAAADANAALAAATEKAAKKVTVEPNSSDSLDCWHIRAESADAPASAVHALRQQLQRGNVLEFEADSGSQANYAPTALHLQNYRTAGHDGHTIVCATGSRTATEGVGSVNSWLDKVYVNEKIVTPILSIPCQFTKGNATLFHPTHGVVLCRAEDMHVSFRNPIATGGLREGTFKLDVFVDPASRQSYVNLTSAERAEARCQLQLARLGYPGPARIVQLAREPAYHLDLPTTVSVADFKVDQNDVYQLAKSREQPHRNLGMKIKAKKPFQQIHVDCIVEPLVGYGNVKYSMVITCDYSGYSHSVNLTSRALVPSALNAWVKTFVKAHGFKVSRIRMDNAGEQIGAEMKKFLVDNSIAPEFSSANSSASNGVAERANQTLETLSRAILLGSKLPEKAWPLTNDAAAFLKNRLPTRRNPDNMTPYERVFGVKPDLSGLRVVGCRAYLHAFKPTGLKLDPRATIGTMVGYDDNSRRYRILTDPVRGTVVLSSNVTFAENIVNLTNTVRSLPGFRAKHVLDNDDDDVDDADIPAPAPVPAVPGGINVPANAPVITPAPPRYPLAATTLPLPPEDDERHRIDHNVPPPQMEGFNRNDDDDPFGEDFAPDYIPDDDGDNDPAPEEGDAVIALDDPEDVEELLIPELQAPDRPKRDRKAPAPIQFPASQIRGYRKVPAKYYKNLHGTRIGFKEALDDPLLREAAAKELREILSPPPNYALDPTFGRPKAAVEIVSIPPGVNLIDSVWVFKKKFTQDNVYDRAKARVAPRGFKQRAGVDFDPDAVQAPTLSMDSAMLLLALQVNRNMDVTLIDFNSAFQHTALDMPIYMKFPAGMTAKPGKCLKLNNALQGSKQAAHLFHVKLAKFLISMSYRQSVYDPCVFTKWVGGELSVVGVYVDDCRCLSEGPKAKESLDNLFEQLKDVGPCKIADPNNWLGMKIDHDRVKGTLRVTQPNYIEKMLLDFNMQDCKPCRTPAAPGTKLLKTADGVIDAAASEFPFRSAVGALLWPARTARPEILYAVNQCGAQAHNPDRTHVTAVKRIFRYLKGTGTLGITLRRNPTGELRLHAFSDADYAGEPEENETPMRSLSGMIVYLAGIGPIFTKSSLQSTVARSTAESEYKSASVAGQVVAGLRNLLEDIGFPQDEASPIGGDNQATLAQLKSRLAGSKARHVKVDFHYVRELVQQKEVAFYYVPTAQMVADIMTKALPIAQFEILRDRLLTNL